MQSIVTIYDLRDALLQARIMGKLRDIGQMTVMRDTLLVETYPDKRDLAINLLRDILGTRLFDRNGTYFIQLNDHSKEIVALFEELDINSENVPYPLVPLLRDIALLSENLDYSNLCLKFSFPEQKNNAPYLHTFFSFKGGVGRTMHLTSVVRHFAGELHSEFANPQILLIDADTEAPGITWWTREDFPNPSYSYLDLLADAAEGITCAVTAAYEKIRSVRLEMGSQNRTVFYLPAFRDTVQLLRPPVSPEQLTLSSSHPWFMGDLLLELGKKLGVQHVFVDLRAGMSELSSPLFFDPRTRRVLVTTTSQQSIDGTRLALNELAKFSSLSPEEQKNTYADNTRVLINFVPPDEKNSSKLEELTVQLEEVIDKLSPEHSESTDANTGSWLVYSNYDQTLLGLGDFESALAVLEKSVSAREVCTQLWRDFVPIEHINTLLPSEPERQKDLDALKSKTAALIYAENQCWNIDETSSWANHFLKIEPYRQLAVSFLSKIPNACIVGAKGSGKTFFFQLLSAMGDWKTFCKSLDMVDSNNATLIPLFWSKSLSDESRQFILKSYTENMKDSVNPVRGNSEAFAEIERLLDDTFRDSQKKSATEWRNLWFEYLMKVFGVLPQAGQSAEEACKQRLIRQEKSIVFLFDGFEELFSNWVTYSEHIEPLRVFLQDIIQNITEWSNGKVGILLFIRKDIVHKAILQNAAQFISLYSKYELHWSKEEALRLVGWILIATKLNKYCGNKSTIEWSSLSFEEMSEALEPFWGQKLGAKNSKEAYSVNWALSAISDFKGNIQARDIVRLLHEAAKKQTPSQTNADRLLAPGVLKSALKECGREKINEIKAEMPALTKSIDKLATTQEKLPFSLEDFSKMGITNISLMEDFGLVFRDEKGNYYLPEIYRQGLGLNFSTGARPKVVSLMRKALGQS